MPRHFRCTLLRYTNKEVSLFSDKIKVWVYNIQRLCTDVSECYKLNIILSLTWIKYVSENVG